MTESTEQTETLENLFWWDFLYIHMCNNALDLNANTEAVCQVNKVFF